MAETPSKQRASFIDRVIAWVLALLLGMMGVPAVLAMVIAPFQPERAGTINDGFTGLSLLYGIGFTYGAAATLREEYGMPRAWRPSWTQGFVLSWYVGWTLLILLALARDLLRGGPELAAKWLGGGLIMWFILVGLPWLLATLHDRRRREASGWVDFG